MITVGLTGNVASGKSAVAQLWREAGVPVASADQFAREAVAPGTSGLAEVVERFGAEVLDSEGGLDRAAMRARVFGDVEARRALEAIIHPRVLEARDRWLREQEASGVALAAVEIPLLFEVGADRQVDRVVLVVAPEEVRLERMIRDRGLAAEEAAKIIASQMPSDGKESRSHHVIRNTGTLADLQEAAFRVLDELQGAEPSPGAGVPEGQ